MGQMTHQITDPARAAVAEPVGDAVTDAATDPAKGKGERTRDRILVITEEAVLQKGFGATSIEEIISEAGITKSGFFYHFKDKNELARALLIRHIEQDEILLDQVFERGKELADDPLQQFLIGLKMFAELVEDLPKGHPGCLVAAYCYQERLFDREIYDLNQQAVLAWRKRFRVILDKIVEQYPPNEPVDIDELADMVATVIEGGIVMSKALGQPHLLANQMMLLRSFIKLLFVK